MFSKPASPGTEGNHERYIQSLPVPTPEKIHHIAKIQEEKELQAAQLIQRQYRGSYELQRPNGKRLSTNERWNDAIKQAQYNHLTTPTSRRSRELAASSIDLTRVSTEDSDSKRRTSGRDNWRKATQITKHALADDPSDDEFDVSSLASNPSERRKQLGLRKSQKTVRGEKAKIMSLRYFLEMIDTKHRYGSNLRAYHQEWQRSNTDESFFYWLDQGEGKIVDLKLVPRQRLDSEQVRYLSREERRNYLVRINNEGRLCWAKNGARIDTTEAFRDSVQGIVPQNDKALQFRARKEHEQMLKPSPDFPSLQETDNEDAGQRYGNHELKKKGTTLKSLLRVSPAIILNKLMRKTVKKNTWIFVADTSFRLYVGIKQTGAFQHSSFLNGARLSAAGLIEIEDGVLTALSPLSGHYRPPASNFREFVHALKERDIDISHVSISKSYAVLVGLEAYASARRRLKLTRNAFSKLSRRSKGKGLVTATGQKMTEEDTVLKKEFDGGLDDHQGLRSGLKDFGMVVPTVSLPIMGSPEDISPKCTNERAEKDPLDAEKTAGVVALAAGVA